MFIGVIMYFTIVQIFSASDNGTLTHYQLLARSESDNPACRILSDGTVTAYRVCSTWRHLCKLPANTNKDL